MVERTLERARLWEVQTPQVVRPELLARGYELVEAEGLEVTDDVSIVEALGEPVKITKGSYENIKVCMCLLCVCVCVCLLCVCVCVCVCACVCVCVCACVCACACECTADTGGCARLPRRRTSPSPRSCSTRGRPRPPWRPEAA